MLEAGPATILQEGKVHVCVWDIKVAATRVAFCDILKSSLLRVSFSKQVEKSLSLQGLEKTELGQTENRLRKVTLIVFLSELKDEQ